MAEYLIRMINPNKNMPAPADRTVTAHSFKTVGEFVDFADERGNVVLRVKADLLVTIERTSE